VAARAKENQVAGGGDQKSGCQISDKAIKPIDTKKEIAKAADVSRRPEERDRGFDTGEAELRHACIVPSLGAYTSPSAID
jgi:hypothetical protein